MPQKASVVKGSVIEDSFVDAIGTSTLSKCAHIIRTTDYACRSVVRGEVVAADLRSASVFTYEGHVRTDGSRLANYIHHPHVIAEDQCSQP